MTFYRTETPHPLGKELDIPPPVSSLFSNPSGYLPDERLEAAVNTALLLGQPLLITGDPGTGKTQLASHVARQLGLLPPICFEVKSTTEASHFFYQVDTLRQFRDYSQKESDSTPNPLDYIHFQGLGLAILRAANQEGLKQLQSKFEHNREKDGWGDMEEGDWKEFSFPHRSVVLIDEIDKAPRDVPNDLLNEMEKFFFKIPELKESNSMGTVYARDDKRPIIIMTSNSEKNLPDAFLRRCVFYHIEFPTSERLKKIIKKRMGENNIGVTILDDIAVLLKDYQKGSTALDRKPGTSEVLFFLEVLKRQGVKLFEQGLSSCYTEAYNAMSVLGKNQGDLEKARSRLKARFGPKEPGKR